MIMTLLLNIKEKNSTMFKRSSFLTGKFMKKITIQQNAIVNLAPTSWIFMSLYVQISKTNVNKYINIFED